MAQGTGSSGSARAVSSATNKKKTSSTKKRSGTSAIKVSQPKAPAKYVPSTYASAYDNRINTALGNVTNFKYNPLQDASYQALAKVYGERGNLAAKDTLADAAALNGGMQTSYAVSAAQQARNQYNQELAAMIPELEANAFNRAQVTYNALRDADDTAYGRFRDTEGDRQWKYGMDYDAYRDRMGDYQFGVNFNYQRARDLIGDNQWSQEFAYQKQRDKVADQQWAQEYALSKKGSSGSSGGGSGRRSSGSSSSGYSSSTTSSENGMPITREDYDNILNNNKKKKTGGGSTRGSISGNKAVAMYK